MRTHVWCIILFRHILALPRLAYPYRWEVRETLYIPTLLSNSKINVQKYKWLLLLEIVVLAAAETLMNSTLLCEELSISFWELLSRNYLQYEYRFIIIPIVCLQQWSDEINFSNRLLRSVLSKRWPNNMVSLSTSNLSKSANSTNTNWSWWLFNANGTKRISWASFYTGTSSEKKTPSALHPSAGTLMSAYFRVYDLFKTHDDPCDRFP